MKINRRDYLLQMGAGAAGVLAAADSPLFGQTKKRPSSRRQVQSSANREVTRGLRWLITNDKPSRDAFVTAIYCGLAQFADHDNKFVDVAFNQGNGRHKLEIQIYKNPDYPRSCTMDVPPITPSPNEQLKLVVAGQQGPAPNVFHVDSKPFDRNSTDSTYADDFRWLPELHKHPFYEEGYALNRVRGPRLAVHTGTFYTRVRTNSTFKLVDDDARRPECDEEIVDFGHIALYMATAITAQRNVLLLDRNDRPLYTFEIGNKYQIVFRNECHSCTDPNPNECHDETTRNDFHFNRKVVRVPDDRLKYGLKVKRSCEETRCARPDFCITPPITHRFSDESPCSGSGYGKAPGIP